MAAQFWGFMAAAVLAAAPAAAGDAPAVRFDQARLVACHNCFEPPLAPTLAAALDKVTAIEIDFWPDNGLLWGAGEDYYVRHGGTNGEFGNVNNCRLDGGSGFLSDCLAALRRWHDDHPGHEPVTVFLDIKQVLPGWFHRFDPDRLDAVIARSLDVASIFRPAELKGAHATVRAAAQAGAWPARDQLKGRIILALTGGWHFDRASSQIGYVRARGDKALAFVTADATTPEAIEGLPAGWDKAADLAGWVAIYNVKATEIRGAVGAAAGRQGFVTRAWSPEPDSEATTWMLQHEQGITFTALYGAVK